MGGRLYRAHLCTSAASLSLLAITWPTRSYAQDAPPPSRFVLDEHGVNLATATRTQRELEVSIGAGRAAFNSYVTRKGTGLTKSDFDLNVYQSGPGLSFAILGPNGQESEVFSQSGNTFTSVEGDGATVTLSGSTYILVLADGTKYIYSTNLTTPDSARLARATSITQPNGDSYTMSWLITSNCVNQYQSGCSGANINVFAHKIVRLTSVTNAYGYAIGYTYQSNYVGDATWATLSKVTAYNTLADTAQTWPSVAYSQSQSGGTSTLTATDALNQTTTYSSSSGREAVRLPGSSSDDLVVTTNAYGQVTSITQGGKTWQYAFSYSAPNRSVTITNPDGSTRQVVSDTNVGLPTSVKDEDGNTLSYQYDSSGRLYITTAPDGHQTKLTYNNRGDVTETRIISSTPGTPGDLVATATYDSTCSNAVTCNQPSQTFDANQRETDYTYDPTFGAVTKITSAADGNGVHPETRYTYGGQQAPTGGTVYLLTSTSSCRTQASCIGSADEIKSTITYGPAAGKNNLLAIASTTAAGDGSLSTTTNLQYDLVGNLTGVDGPLPGSGDTTNISYDAMRRRTAVVGPDPDGSGPLNRRAVVYNYLPNGLVNSVSAGTTDSAGNNFSALQQVVTSYDGNLRKVKTATSAGGTTYSVTQYGYDGMNRLQCVATRMDPNQWGAQTDPCAPQTTGPNGPDRVAFTHYEPAGRPDYVISGYGTSVATTEATAQYTPLGLPKNVKDANNNTTSYGYDGFGRLTTTTYPDSSYEQLGYDPNGNLTSRRLRDGQVLNYTYDALNRRIYDDNPNTGIAEVDVSYYYDNLGHLTQAADQNGWYKAYEYDALGRMTREYGNVSDNHLQYDAAGRRTRQTWADGFYVTYDHDAAGETTAIRENGGTALASYGYDDLGRRTSLSRANGVTTTYGYDPVSRLTSLAHDLNGTAGDLTIGFGYNAAGQITSRTSSNDLYAWSGAVNVDRSYTANGLNQYTASGSVTPTYDARGNLTSAGGATYQYNTRNQLYMSGGQLTYSNPAGELGQVQAEGLNLDWVAGQLATEWTSTIQRRYVYGPGDDEPLVWYEGPGTTDKRWLLADERGSVIAVTNGSGDALDIKAYDEYGIPSDTTPANAGRFGYTGQAWLPSIGMNYYKARIYSPTLGRFLQTDPIGYGDGLNWYNYVGSDPVNFSDPTGLICTVTQNYEDIYKGFTDGHVEFVGRNYTGVSLNGCDGSSGSGGGGGPTPGGGGGGLPGLIPPITLPEPQNEQPPICTRGQVVAQAIGNRAMQVGREATKLGDKAALGGTLAAAGSAALLNPAGVLVSGLVADAGVMVSVAGRLQIAGGAALSVLGGRSIRSTGTQVITDWLPFSNYYKDTADRAVNAALDFVGVPDRPRCRKQ